MQYILNSNDVKLDSVLKTVLKGEAILASLVTAWWLYYLWDGGCIMDIGAQGYYLFILSAGPVTTLLGTSVYLFKRNRAPEVASYAKKMVVFSLLVIALGFLSSLVGFGLEIARYEGICFVT